MSQKNKHKTFRLGKFFLWFFIALILLIFSASIFLYYNAERLINDNFSDYIYKKTNQTYRINFESLHIDFLAQDIVVSNLSFQPDSSVQTDSLKTLYQFNTNELKISKIELVPLFRERRFVAESFKVKRPEFKLNSGENVNLEQISKNQIKKGDTLIIPVFKEIFFDTLMIIDAKLNIDTLFSSGYGLPKINIKANHFKIGGKKFTDSPFPFDVSDVSLGVENLHENLPDSIHQINIKQINLSLMHSIVSANDIRLSPIENRISKNNRYTIYMPEVELHASQIEQLPTSDTISIESMIITKPEIEIKFGSKVQKGTPLNEINLYELIGGSLKWVKIQQFSIKNADVKMIPSANENIAQHFESLFVNFYDFKVDSNSYKDPLRILSAKNLNISLKKFTLNHIDNVHQLTIEDLKASSSEKRVKSGKIEFKPILTTSNREINTVIRITSEGLLFKGIDFLKMYHEQIIPMQELQIKSPVTEIGFERKTKKVKAHKDKNLILEKTEDYIKGIYVDKTTITNGSLNYNYIDNEDNSGFFKTKYNIELTQLSIDKETFNQSDKIFFADNFELNFTNINLQLADEKHRMLVESFDLSSKEKSADLRNLKVISINEKIKDTLNLNLQSEQFDIYFPRISLTGANLHQAFFYKKLFIYNFNIYNPVFNIEKSGNWSIDHNNNKDYQNVIFSLMSDYMDKISIRNLTMNNGTLNLVQHKKNKSDFELSNLFSIKMKNFEIDENSSKQKNKLFFSDDIDLVLKNHTLTMADGVHKLDAKEIGILSSEKKVYIKDANLYPGILSESFKNIPLSVFAEIPYMEITDADIFGLFNNGIFSSNHVSLTNPKIKLLFQKTEKKTKNEKQKKPIFILNDLKSISAKKISIKKGQLELANYEDFKSNSFIHTDVDFDLDNFKIVQQQNNFKTTYSNFAFNLKDITYDLPDKLHSLNIAQLQYKLSRKNLDIKDISLAPLKHISLNEKKQFINIDIPKITINDFDFVEFIESRNITTENLLIDQPKLQIKDNRIENKKTFSPYQLNLYPKIKAFANSININQIDIVNATINLENDHPIQLNRINLTANNFAINKNNTNASNLLNSKNVKIQIDDISGKTKDGYFQYGIDRIKINDMGNFDMKGISLKPVYSSKDFARKKIYQADYFTIENIDVIGNKLDLKKLIENKSISIVELNLDFHNVSIHRDKTYPLDPKQSPLMPQQAIRDIKQVVNIAKTHITYDKFIYSELEPKASNYSFVNFTNGSISISNFTNDRKLLDINPHMIANINGKLMGYSETNINIDFDVRSFGNEFTFNATVDQLPLYKLNSITENGLNLSIKEGVNQKMEVYFEANGDSAIGDMRFQYNDLKISVLNAKDGHLKEGKFISFLVNAIAVKSDNPKAGRIMLPTKFKNHRDKQRSVVGYCWKSIFAGIKSTLGIKEKEEPK